MAKEQMKDWRLYARGLAKAERELKIEHWVFIFIKYKEADGQIHRLIHMTYRGNYTKNIGGWYAGE